MKQFTHSPFLEILLVSLMRSTNQIPGNCIHIMTLLCKLCTWKTSEGLKVKILTHCGVPNRNQSFVLLSQTSDWFLYEMQHWTEMD